MTYLFFNINIIKFADKSPSTSISTLEPIITLQQTSSDILKNLCIPKKPPELIENETILKQKLTEYSSAELSPDKHTKVVDIEHFHGSSELYLMHEAQPHHSSQCGNCPHCGKIYSNQSALKYHVRLVHSDLTNMYCCHLCPESFDYREGFKKHMVEVHNVRN